MNFTNIDIILKVNIEEKNKKEIIMIDYFRIIWSEYSINNFRVKIFNVVDFGS